jgi:gluconate 2-dehydrogenase gamma chain
MAQARTGRVSRRSFLRSAGVAAVAAPVLLDACNTQTEAPEAYEGSPSPAISAQPPGVLRFFTANEAAVIEVLLDQIIPGAQGVPSASEAGVLDFVDQRLARDEGVPTYLSPPFAKAYSGPTPPGPDTDQVIWVPTDVLYRYGIQEVELTSAQVYRRSVELLDAYCQDRFGAGFASLSNTQQGTVWDALSNGKVDTFVDSPTSSRFVNLLSSDAAQGWLADPMYGGNRNLSVWKAIGYPGVQRAYTPAEMRAGRPADRRTQSFSMMHAAEVGQPAPGVLLPEAGTEAGDVSGPSGDQVEFECRTTPA